MCRILLIVGYDATPEARIQIDKRAIYGDMIQHADKIDKLTIEGIAGFFAGHVPSSVIHVPIGSYTTESPSCFVRFVL